MRKTKLFLIFSIFIFFLTEFSYAQEPNLKKILLDIEKGEIDKARILLVSLEKGNPNSPQVNFLKAILSDDGLEAAKLYREVAFSAEKMLLFSNYFNFTIPEENLASPINMPECSENLFLNRSM